MLEARCRADPDAVVVPLDLDPEAEQLVDERAGASFDQALDRALLAPALALLSTAEQHLLAAAYVDDQDDRGLGHQLHLRPGTAKRRRQRAVRHLAVVLATGQPPRRQRHWFRRPVGMSERACKHTAAARQRPTWRCSPERASRPGLFRAKYRHRGLQGVGPGIIPGPRRGCSWHRRAPLDGSAMEASQRSLPAQRVA